MAEAANGRVGVAGKAVGLEGTAVGIAVVVAEAGTLVHTAGASVETTLVATRKGEEEAGGLSVGTGTGVGMDAAVQLVRATRKTHEPARRLPSRAIS